jgi:hypothetical protein
MTPKAGNCEKLKLTTFAQWLRLISKSVLLHAYSMTVYERESQSLLHKFTNDCFLPSVYQLNYVSLS